MPHIDVLAFVFDQRFEHSKNASDMGVSLQSVGCVLPNEIIWIIDYNINNDIRNASVVGCGIVSHHKGFHNFDAKHVLLLEVRKRPKKERQDPLIARFFKL